MLPVSPTATRDSNCLGVKLGVILDSSHGGAGSTRHASVPGAYFLTMLCSGPKGKPVMSSTPDSIA